MKQLEHLYHKISAHTDCIYSLTMHRLYTTIYNYDEMCLKFDTFFFCYQNETRLASSPRRSTCGMLYKIPRVTIFFPLTDS